MRYVDWLLAGSGWNNITHDYTSTNCCLQSWSSWWWTGSLLETYKGSLL